MADIKSFPNNQDVYVGAEWVMKWLHGRTSGVFGAENNLSVSAVADSMSVEVSDGVGWLSNSKGDGVVFWNDSEQTNGNKLTLTHDVADGVLDRIDRIVVTWETTNYVALPTITVLKGVPSSIPTAPVLTNNSIKRQISLAQVKIPAGTVSLSSAMITDERLDPAVCGLVTDTVTVDTSMIKNQVSGVLGETQSKTAALLKAIKDELSALEAGTAVELKKLLFTNVAVPVSAFVVDTTYQDYGFRAAVSLEGVISSMIPEAVFGVSDVMSGNFAPVVDTYDGGVYIYSESKPEAEVIVPTIICWRGA